MDTQTATLSDRGENPWDTEPRFMVSVDATPPCREVWDAADAGEEDERLRQLGYTRTGPWTPQADGVWTAPVH